MGRRREIPDFIATLLIIRIRNQHANLRRERKFKSDNDRNGMTHNRYYQRVLVKLRYLHRNEYALPSKRNTKELSDAWANYQIAKLKRLYDEMKGWAEFEYRILEKVNTRNFPQEMGYGLSMFLTKQKSKFNSRVEGRETSRSKDSWFRIQQKKLRAYRSRKLETDEEWNYRFFLEMLNNKMKSMHRNSGRLNEDALLLKLKRIHRKID
ncbi:hypothetical protein V6Z05_18035 [Leptospira venezuelensis]|uniref:hypothetical protein n=1 Tax=Leptospira venezuelensis TaxID=1958811 RepID=UPI000A3D5E56|nr:hypothetical protein [Leptospira venezuelensis]